ncbi:MAG: nucleotidyltransferase family protein [Candidatus Woesearchaeota archaeon]
MQKQEIQALIGPILLAHGIKKASLFGSFVRNEQTQHSDLDILVAFPCTFSLFDVVRLKAELEYVVGRKVDLVDYSMVKSRMKPYIQEEKIL